MDLSNIVKYWNIKHAAENKLLVINTMTFLQEDGNIDIKYIFTIYDTITKCMCNSYEGEDFIKLCQYV